MKNLFVLEEYKARINRVVDYIDTNLDKDFSLEELAGVAAFSKFHFHRVFYGMIGETLFQFITRIRVQKAASFLTANPKMTMTQIASACGFADSAHFSRSFKSRFGMSPRDYRTRRGGGEGNAVQENGNFNQTFGNFVKASSSGSGYSRVYQTDSRRNEMEGKVEIKDFPETTVAYVRYIGPYKGDAELFAGLFGKLMSWAGPRGLATAEAKSLIVYHDNPEITEESKLRVSVCLTVPKNTQVDGEIGRMTIEKGRYAFARFRPTPAEYTAAWNWVFSEWLPSSGWQCDDKPCFELYHGGEDAEGRVDVDICVPVRPL